MKVENILFLLVIYKEFCFFWRVGMSLAIFGIKFSGAYAANDKDKCEMRLFCALIDICAG
ncbi:hypothetical protein [Providencia stuartii]|uniref:hypothetical protein n=1 Tax=Providencia stuartii TaxID=588 RepID=UPI0018C5AA33|nr:hypothetical protein [Providencia stuartii]MBG5919286.1 hypothetical protein [Providencia stuartii]